ncbi:cytochrome c family protein [Roseivivax sp. GX 12232]|uniref:c-type cytochrome n=1 Tax=Roseivivax sp. GX 12232 TaxID=2900547 RepID=UPI001E5734BD|nr:cytochrome c family protein [Roseivivax sp. GX 12232]MCE0505085.1 cytochrome c family protein [Roseivivax sp. GX 12232]
MFNKLLAASVLAMLPAGMAWAESHESGEGMEITGDPEAGERVYRKCMACHMVGEDAQNRVGPQQNGVVGRDVAAVEGFNYSDALMEKGEEGVVWTPENLDAFLENPREWAPGTKMSFAGLRKEEERADVIAYLATYNADGTRAE